MSKEKTKKLSLVIFPQALMVLSKNLLTPTHSWHHPQKSSKQKFPDFLYWACDTFCFFGGFEQLSSFTCWKVMTGHLKSK